MKTVSRTLLCSGMVLLICGHLTGCAGSRLRNFVTGKTSADYKSLEELEAEDQEKELDSKTLIAGKDAAEDDPEVADEPSAETPSRFGLASRVAALSPFGRKSDVTVTEQDSNADDTASGSEQKEGPVQRLLAKRNSRKTANEDPFLTTVSAEAVDESGADESNNDDVESDAATRTVSLEKSLEPEQEPEADQDFVDQDTAESDDVFAQLMATKPAKQADSKLEKGEREFDGFYKAVMSEAATVSEAADTQVEEFVDDEQPEALIAKRTAAQQSETADKHSRSVKAFDNLFAQSESATTESADEASSSTPEEQDPFAFAAKKVKQKVADETGFNWNRAADTAKAVTDTAASTERWWGKSGDTTEVAASGNRNEETPGRERDLASKSPASEISARHQSAKPWSPFGEATGSQSADTANPALLADSGNGSRNAKSAGSLMIPPIHVVSATHDAGAASATTGSLQNDPFFQKSSADTTNESVAGNAAANVEKSVVSELTAASPASVGVFQWLGNLSLTTWMMVVGGIIVVLLLFAPGRKKAINAAH